MRQVLRNIYIFHLLLHLMNVQDVHKKRKMKAFHFSHCCLIVWDFKLRKEKKMTFTSRFCMVKAKLCHINLSCNFSFLLYLYGSVCRKQVGSIKAFRLFWHGSNKECTEDTVPVCSFASSQFLPEAVIFCVSFDALFTCAQRRAEICREGLLMKTNTWDYALHAKKNSIYSR